MLSSGPARAGRRSGARRRPAAFPAGGRLGRASSAGLSPKSMSGSARGPSLVKTPGRTRRPVPKPNALLHRHVAELRDTVLDAVVTWHRRHPGRDRADAVAAVRAALRQLIETEHLSKEHDGPPPPRAA